MPSNAEMVSIMKQHKQVLGTKPMSANTLEDDHNPFITKSPNPTVVRGSQLDITWQTFNPNLRVEAGSAGGSLAFRRTKYGEHDVALGQAITSGCHEWTVVSPNGNANNFVGVSSSACDKRIYPAATSAWAVYFHDAELCSGSAAKSSSRGYTRSDGSHGYMDPPARKGHGTRNPLWAKRALNPIPRCTPIQAILDMDQHTLAFAIGDAEPQLAFTNLPDSVHPYICSGDHEDRSLIEVYGGSHVSKA